MSSYQGKFVWHELMTSDTESAEAFYRAVHGWRTQDAGLPDRRYTILSAGGANKRPAVGKRKYDVSLRAPEIEVDLRVEGDHRR